MWWFLLRRTWQQATSRPIPQRQAAVAHNQLPGHLSALPSPITDNHVAQYFLNMMNLDAFVPGNHEVGAKHTHALNTRTYTLTCMHMHGTYTYTYTRIHTIWMDTYTCLWIDVEQHAVRLVMGA